MKPMLDFSILDKQQSSKTPQNALKSPLNAFQDVGQYEISPQPQDALKRTIAPLDDVQVSKVEISQGIRAGSDPYPLLLKAVQLISILTGEREFYTIHRDIMQGMGVLEQVPAEWERDSVNTSLQKLEACRRNIDNAIKTHQQWLDGQPLNNDMDITDEYDRRVKKCFGAAYKFLDEHKHVRTNEAWERIAKSLSPYVDPLTVDLVVAAVSELEREQKCAMGE